MSGIRTVHVRVEGRVQNVGYRAWVETTARDIGLVGWVRNRSDKSVEAVLQGKTGDIEQMLTLCRKGPPAARVDKIDVRDEAEATTFGIFEVRPNV